MSHLDPNCPASERRWRSLAVATLVIGGCSSFSPSGPALPVGAIPMAEGPEYRAWFAKTELCSGLKGQYDVVQWFVVPGAETFSTREGPKVGIWEKSGRSAKIVVAGNYSSHEMVIRHEMLHHLLDREGHPGAYFVDRCHLTWESWSAVGDR